MHTNATLQASPSVPAPPGRAHSVPRAQCAPSHALWRRALPHAATRHAAAGPRRAVYAFSPPPRVSLLNFVHLFSIFFNLFSPSSRVPRAAIGWRRSRSATAHRSGPCPLRPAPAAFSLSSDRRGRMHRRIPRCASASRAADTRPAPAPAMTHGPRPPDRRLLTRHRGDSIDNGR